MTADCGAHSGNKYFSGFIAVKYNSPLIEGRLIKRYKRFLADVKLGSGETITVHCANTGAMTGCQPADARIWLSRSDNARRKYAHSWELVELEQGAMACINTGLTNRVAHEAIVQGDISELAGYPQCHTEVRYGNEGSRVDLVLESGEQRCFVEVKHVTLKLDNGLGAFPDAVSLRGQKHLRELMQQVKLGHRAVMLFIIMRDDVSAFCPADQVDADYGKLLREAAECGVELLAYQAHISPDEIKLAGSLPVYL
jgi:sugar fermentation stimulation protein A